MRFRAYIIPALFALSLAVPVLAGEQDEPERLEFKRYGHEEQYTFEQYVADLKEAARSKEVRPDNPVSQLASNQHKEYKPLNPVTIFRW